MKKKKRSQSHFTRTRRFVIYSAEHPDRTSAIAITSADGSYTYPLLGNDGFNYHAPNWKP